MMMLWLTMMTSDDDCQPQSLNSAMADNDDNAEADDDDE